MDSSLDWPEGESNQPAEEPEAEDDEEEPLHEEPTAAQIVQAGVARGQLNVANVSTDQRELEITEEQLIQDFIRDSCKWGIEWNVTTNQLHVSVSKTSLVTRFSQDEYFVAASLGT